MSSRYLIETFIGWSAIVTAITYSNVWLVLAGIYVLATRRIDEEHKDNI